MAVSKVDEQKNMQTAHEDESSYVLRHYHLHEQIGQEELTTVYLATHLTLDRPVQIHFLRRADWISISRFQLAARLTAHLGHPNLLPVIDAGHDDDYGDYLVTPHIEGQKLSETLHQEPLEPSLALRIATQIGTVLDYLHSQDVVHRDVQPSNILITPESVAYLTNLTLAASSFTPDLSSVDEADYLTPYSAPEQRLDQGETTAALDIYSLGALIYHMLSGEIPPAPGMDVPSLTVLGAYAGEADVVIRRMMHFEPEARFASVGEAVNALKRALREYVDQPTDDEDVEWEPIAEWLENPLETVLGELLDENFLHKSRSRADGLHRPDAINRILNRWSRKGFFRRPALGHLIQIEQIVSYNIYFYELRTLYETRTPLPPRQRPLRKTDDAVTTQTNYPLWDVAVPEAPPYTEVKPQELVWTGSRRLLHCPECNGTGKVLCNTCKGKGAIERTRKVLGADKQPQTEVVSEVCATCHGYREQRCPACEGSGKLLEEHAFTWARRAYLWKNTDDLEGLPQRSLSQRLEQVHATPIDPFESHWYSVAPLAEMVQEAINSAGDNTRLIATELTIRGVPVTDVDYTLNEKPQTLHIVGFDNDVVGGWTMYNPERIGIIVAAATVVLVLASMLIFVVL